jgi:chromosome segregation protein
MYLKKIEITGFKSFYKKIEIIFPKPIANGFGITVLVGPNGSGKSNVCDALKWGLGMQSKKGFRSKKGKDVLFLGNKIRRSLSSARVLLHFDNSDKKIPLAISEVIITRKIYASGENEYFINNSKVQLKEILQLLGEVGLGEQNYAVVDQGMADRLLFLNPIERRNILEEAAKVKNFIIKKNDGFKKINKTLINLAEIRVVMRELQPKLHYLEKEARKKKDELKLKKEFEKKATIYFGSLYQKLKSKKETLNKNKTAIYNQQKLIDKEIQHLNSSIRKPKDNLKNLEQIENYEKKLQIIQNKLFDLSKKISIIEGQTQVLTEQEKKAKIIKKEETDVFYIKKKLTDLIKNIDILFKKDDYHKNDLLSLKSTVLKLKKEIENGVCVKTKTKLTDAFSEKIKKNKTEIKNLEKTYQKLTNQKSLINQKILNIKKEEQQDKYKYHQSKEKLENLRYDKESLKDQINEFDVALAKLEVKEEDLKNKTIQNLRIIPEKIKFKKQEDLDLSKLEFRLDTIKQKINISESIDPSIIDEYEKTFKKAAYYKKETKDLTKTIKSLKKINNELELKINKRFSKTLLKINKNFTKYFRMLFDQGTAELVKFDLTEEMNQSDNNFDIASSNTSSRIGIDVKIKIPNKKVNNLEMLSGGEKTLTSLALLFAMIKSSCPPFVILDEVDAALDERNSALIAQIIQSISKKTQILIITHNQKIMQKAQVLYGVLMQKDGVSKLLSVDLNKKCN